MSSQWPTFKAMTFLRLREGPSDGQELEIAPTMRELTVRGERYFRMDKVRTMRGEEYGGAYLWDGWELPRRPVTEPSGEAS